MEIIKKEVPFFSCSWQHPTSHQYVPILTPVPALGKSDLLEDLANEAEMYSVLSVDFERKLPLNTKWKVKSAGVGLLAIRKITDDDYRINFDPDNESSLWFSYEEMDEGIYYLIVDHIFKVN